MTDEADENMSKREIDEAKVISNSKSTMEKVDSEIEEINEVIVTSPQKTPPPTATNLLEQSALNTG